MLDSTLPSRQSKIHFVPDVDHAPRKPARSNSTKTTDPAPRPRRSSAPVYMASVRRPYSLIAGGSTTESDPALGVFSDEYDLSQEDPRILQDVQRALKLKAKRETGQNRASSSAGDPFLPLNPLVSKQHPRQGIGVPPFPTMTLDLANTSDIDFGPSVGNNTTTADDHPIPSSLDNGVSLDWSGFGYDEKRWHISIKRKGKGLVPHLNILVQQQEKSHLERLENIRKRASQSTLQKAYITKDQLMRRYDLLPFPRSRAEPLRLVDVARWYQLQEKSFQDALEQEEPQTWLKHLQKKRKRSVRSPWQVATRVIEEYIHARDGPIMTPPRNDDIQIDARSGRSLSPPSFRLFPVTSPGSSRYSFDPVAPRRSSYEGLLSFEPLTRSSRESPDVRSRRSAESGYSSAGSKSSNRKHWRKDLSTGLQRRITRESEQVISGPTSLSEVSIAEGSPLDNYPRTDGKAISADAKIKFVVTPGSDLQNTSEGNGSASSNVVGTDDVSLSQPAPGVGGHAEKIRQEPHRLAPWIQNKRRRRINKEKSRREYESKAGLLEEATAQNHRIRQLLNRVSIVVKEYEIAQANASAPLDNHHQLHRLPRDLLEAFSHDPAAVTGPTRRLRGYKAVDDIHSRLVKQRTICKQFLSENTRRPTVDCVRILRDPAQELESSLKSLQQFKNDIQIKASKVAELLKQVQDIHIKAKANYNDTLSHTSEVYPELSDIVALEESYKDQYQQFWEIGMDALTFILDSVTPFWRTYGKTIGEDIRDFLIIPLYRNEFTGEAKRYPLTCVPRRTFRHWLGLGLLYSSTITLTQISTRIAITLVGHGGLRSITYESIRWIALPFFWFLIAILWLFVLINFIVLLLEFTALFWWAGWLIKIFS